MRRAREYSAGGVVVRDRKVLLVRMRNLRGEPVWTFPKGHLEGDETPRRAAVREVLEETGHACRVLETLALVRYSFRRDGASVSKKVRWYRMEPLSRPGRPNPREILALRWSSYSGAKSLLVYPGDLRLLDKVRRKAL